MFMFVFLDRTTQDSWFRTDWPKVM